VESSAAPPEVVGNKAPNPRLNALAKDTNVEISVELLSGNKLKDQILAVFHVRNISENAIEKAQFSFEVSSNFKIGPHPSRQPTDPIPLTVLPAPNTSIILKLPFQYITFVEPQKLNGSFEYSSGKIDFTLNFPVSASIVPEDITPDNFLALVADEALEIRYIENLNTTIQKATAKLGVTLRLKLISKEDTKVSLYGRTPFGFHIFVLIKIEERDELIVAIKSDSAVLLDNLVSEVKAFDW